MAALVFVKKFAGRYAKKDGSRTIWTPFVVYPIGLPATREVPDDLVEEAIASGAAVTPEEFVKLEKKAKKEEAPPAAEPEKKDKQEKGTGGGRRKK